MPGMRQSRIGRAIPWCCALLGWGSACVGDDGTSEGAGTGVDSETSVGAEDAVAGGDFLGCAEGQRCTLVLVSQTLDDRIEIFDPGNASPYRGAIDLDLKPNVCEGCELGDHADGRLDEPFGLVRAGGYLHVSVGHYPDPTHGTLVSFPLSMFEALTPGATLSVADYFDRGSFIKPTFAQELGELEPIFVTAIGERVLIGVFNNDLFATEDTWMQPGKLLVVDAADPAAPLGEVDLGQYECNGAAQVVSLGTTTLAVACDGNERVAVLDVPALQTTPPVDVGATITGTTCEIPGAMADRRVRYLAPDGSGGFVVAEGPTPLSLMSGSRLWHFDGSCQMLGLVSFSGAGQVGEVERFAGETPTWLVATAGVLDPEQRGVHVVRSSGGSLEICQTLEGFSAHWTTADGELEPFGLAVRSDGSGVAVGAGPFQPASAGPGFGKVLWAELEGVDDPCTMTATVTDLTDGAFAPAVDPGDAATFRRAPHVVELVELRG